MSNNGTQPILNPKEASEAYSRYVARRDEILSDKYHRTASYFINQRMRTGDNYLDVRQMRYIIPADGDIFKTRDEYCYEPNELDIVKLVYKLTSKGWWVTVSDLRNSNSPRLFSIRWFDKEPPRRGLFTRLLFGSESVYPPTETDGQ